MILKFWAWVYRKTGYFSNYAKAKQMEYIEDNGDKLDEYYVALEDCRPQDALGLLIGIWQGEHGFYRAYSLEDLFPKDKEIQ